jgi:hypothetical protein
MLFWKLFAGVDVLVAVGYLWSVWSCRESFRLFDAIGTAVWLVGSGGMIIYAFSLPAISQPLWRAFLPIFLAVGAWEISAEVKRGRIRPATLAGIVVGLLVVSVNSVALYRLGGSHWLGL